MRSLGSLVVFSMLLVSFAARAQSLQKIYTYAGNGTSGYGGDGTNASGASLWGPIDVAVDGSNNVYVVDHLNYRVRKINAGGLITTIVGTGAAGNTGNSSIGTSAAIVPRGLALDKAGNLFVSDDASSVIRKVNSTGIITGYAGLGIQGYAGDGGPATAARFRSPSGIAIDSSGNMYVADLGNHVVRKISNTGTISTIAGTNVAGYAGDGGPATAAVLDSPYAVAADKMGNVYVTDYRNNVIRKIDTGHKISTIAGMMGVYGYAGDNGMATDAKLNNPRGLTVDTAGNLYIADAGNNVIRKIDATGTITTVAGNGTYGFGGDLGFAVGANLFNPYSMAVDVHGSIYIADANNERIRKTYLTTVSTPQLAPGAAGIQVYPNPATDAIVVTGLAINDNVAIYDVAGRLVAGPWAVSTAAAQRYNVGRLAAGTYVLKTTGAAGGTTAAQRFTKD